MSAHTITVKTLRRNRGNAYFRENQALCAGCFKPFDPSNATRCWSCGFLFHWHDCRGSQYVTSGSPKRIPCVNCCDES